MALIFTIFPNATSAYAAIEELKFDQSEIPKGHSDVITIIESAAPSISQISFAEFEFGFNTWTNIATADPNENDCWYRDSGGTGTPSTGPSKGAPGTTGQDTDWYVYYEASNGCSPNPHSNPPPNHVHYGILLGPSIDFDAYNSVQVTFWRHMWDGVIPTDNVGKLVLELENSPGSGIFSEIWSEQGNQQDLWEKITVDLSSENNSGLRQLRFVAHDMVAGTQGDMAVDQIKIQGIAIGPPASIEIYTDDFESAYTWNNVTSGEDDNDCWRTRSGPTPTANTGPNGPQSGSNYIFYESSNGCSPGTGQQAFLLHHRTIDFNSYSGVEVEFWRHMLGNQMGKLALELEDSPGSRTFSEVWFQEGDQGSLWEKITVDLSSEDDTGQRQIRFNATETTSGIRGDMAVDNITIRGGSIAHEVSLQAFDSLGLPIGNSMSVTLPKQGPNIYWQLVEFGPGPNDPIARHFNATAGITVEVTDAEGNKNSTLIITHKNGTFIGKNKGLSLELADCNDARFGGDEDNDGVCDAWEKNGPIDGPMVIDYPDGNTYTMDTSPGGVCDSFLQVDPPVKCYGKDQRDIYVEIDYMIGHRPNEEALRQVIKAFANAPSATDPNVIDPIRLHIQIDTNSTAPIGHQTFTKFPGKNNIIPPPTPESNKHGFDQIREVYYGTEDEHLQPQPPNPPEEWGKLQKRQIFHYGLFVHSQSGSTGSGVAEVLGNDLMVHLGYFTGKIGNPDEQAGTFMHELGHNLNLHHGGLYTDESNCKPNHLSVMSYSRQFPIQNIDRTLDYSRQALGDPTHTDHLMESDLTEENGIETYDYNPNEGIIFGPIPPLFPPPTHGNIDWNLKSPDNESGLQINLNGIPSIGGCTNNTNTDMLMGYNDWDIDVMNLDSKDNPGNWGDGRSYGAGKDPAKWDQKRHNPKLVMSQTCPSLKQIIDWSDPAVLSGARDFTSPPSHAIIMQEKIKSHLKNYRVCEGGAGEKNPVVLAATYHESAAFSAQNVLDFYGNNPSAVIDEIVEHVESKQGIIEMIIAFFYQTPPEKALQEKLQYHYSTLDYMLQIPNKPYSTEINLKLQGIKDLIETKAGIFGITLNDTTEETDLKVQRIFAQDELTTDAIKNMSSIRVDSMLQYLKNLDESHFNGLKYDAIQYYMQEFNQTQIFIQNSSYAQAAMVMSSLDHAGKINNSATLVKLELATDSIVDQYTKAIPEFGTIATLILVVAITSIIILTTKTRNIFIPRNYQ